MSKLSDYMALHYPYLLVEGDDGWFARHPDLPGCMSDGRTVAEAMKNLDEARELWIEVRLEDGYDVPLPLEP